MVTYKRSGKSGLPLRRSKRTNPSLNHGPPPKKRTRMPTQKTSNVVKAIHPSTAISTRIWSAQTSQMVLDCVMITRRKARSQQAAVPVRQTATKSDNPAANEPTQASTAPPMQPVQSNTAVSGFKPLSSLPSDKVEEMINSLDIQPADVDKWEIAMHPDTYLQQFNSPLATVTLSSHVPKQKKHSEGDESPYHHDFILLAASSHQIWVEPKFKEPFFIELQKWRLIQPSKVKFQAAFGNAHIPVIVFVHCLKIAVCDTLRIRQYGQKLPMIPQFTMAKPAEVTHLLSGENEWDIGITVKSQYIWLFNPASKSTSNSTQVFPICIPASGDYGLVSFTHKHRGQTIRIKVYPQIVHAIKAFNSRLQGERPKTGFGMRAKGDAIQKVLQQLANLPSNQLGGFRMEVSIQARSLQQARIIAASIPFLVPSFWFNPSSGFSRFKLEAKFVTKLAFLANANWMYQQAVNQKAFQSRNLAKPTFIQQRILSDCFAAIGWNSGYSRTTQSNSQTAWWANLPLAETNLLQSDIVQHLLRNYSDHDSRPILNNLIRTSTEGGFIPCRNDSTNPAHRYHLISKDTYRMRCYHQDCKDNLSFEQAIIWFATMILNGIVNPTKLGLSTTLITRLNRFLPDPEDHIPFDIPPISSLNRIPLSPAWYSTNWTSPNGNCMFEAFGKAFAGPLLTASVVRAKAVSWMAQHKDKLNQFTIESNFGSFNAYLAKMAQFGTWGDSIALHALCSYYQVQVKVLKQDHLGNYIWLPSGDTQFKRKIYLFLANHHYENLISSADVLML